MRAPAWLEDLRCDAIYAGRGLLRARGYALTAILSLALGIGANATVFSLVDALLLRRLPVAQPEQLVILTDPAVGGAAGGLILGERDHVAVGVRDVPDTIAPRTITRLVEHVRAGVASAGHQGLDIVDDWWLGKTRDPDSISVAADASNVAFATASGLVAVHDLHHD